MGFFPLRYFLGGFFPEFGFVDTLKTRCVRIKGKTANLGFSREWPLNSVCACWTEGHSLVVTYMYHRHCCVRVMGDCQREFCSKCGNKTLSRVTVSYNDDGTVQYFLSRHKTFSTRGLRVSCLHITVVVNFLLS